MEENLKLMSVLKIGLEASKQGHSRGGMLRAGLYITSSLARAVGGNIGGEWSMWVKVTAAAARPFPSQFPTNLVHRDPGWPVWSCLPTQRHWLMSQLQRQSSSDHPRNFITGVKSWYSPTPCKLRVKSWYSQHTMQALCKKLVFTPHHASFSHNW